MKFQALTPLGFAAIAIYLAGLAVISILSRRRAVIANDYLNATHSLPTWAAALSFLSYNCGSIEIIGMSAMASQYGIQALHFYWIGGIPGMVFFALVVLPVYIRSGAHSLPEYLDWRFGPRVRLLNACISMVGTASLAGAALYAIAHVLHVILGCNLLLGALVSAMVVLAYVLLGGIRATIYTSIFQFFVVIAGLFPLLMATFPFRLATFAHRPEAWHLWCSLPMFAPNANLDRLGVVAGLGFVVSFSYWCTDFVVVQRALTARGVEEARKVPILAGFGKLAIAFLIVLPGAAAPMFIHGAHAASHDETMPALLALVYGPTLLGLGVAALLSGLMAGFAGNAAGFAAAWTQEIYRVRIRPGRPEQHYIRMGRWAVVMCFLLAGLAAYLAAQFHDLMEFLQLVVSLFYAPLLAAVLAGMFRKQARERDALSGILLGVMTGITLEVCVRLDAIHFGSQMNANFYIAILSFIVSMLVIFHVGRRTHQGSDPVVELPLELMTVSALRPTLITGVLSVLLLATCLALNLIWW